MDPERKKQLERWAIAVGVVLLLLAGAFSAGRFSAPLKVETRDVERVVFKDRVEWKERVVEKVVAAKVETKVVWRDRIIEVGGRVVEHEVEKTGAVTTAEHDTTAEQTRVEVREVEKLKVVEKTVTLRPSWRVSLQAGASLSKPLLPIAGPLVLGASGEYRLIGGWSAGVWLSTVGAAGLVTSLEF